jgi:hypothetical protein
MRVLMQASLASLLAMLVSMTPMVVGLLYALRPNEHKLALMRPLSLAGIFAAAANLFLGLTNALMYASRMESAQPPRAGVAAMVLGEACVMPFIAFACLTIGWLGVAIGMRRHT